MDAFCIIEVHGTRMDVYCNWSVGEDPSPYQVIKLPIKVSTVPRG